jgi:hypothetical protein
MSAEKPASQAGWRIKDWGEAVSLSRSSVFNLLRDQRIEARKYGRSTIILTPPEDFLQSLPVRDR